MNTGISYRRHGIEPLFSVETLFVASEQEGAAVFEGNNAGGWCEVSQSGV